MINKYIRKEKSITQECYEYNRSYRDGVYALKNLITFCNNFLDSIEHSKQVSTEIWELKKQQLLGTLEYLRILNNSVNIPETDEEAKKFQKETNELLNIKKEQIEML